MKKITLCFLLCTIALATGCPISTTPKQPGTFKKLGDRQDDILIKFDNEIANYDCLMAGRTWTETSTAPADQQTQQQLADVRARQREIIQRLKTLEKNATANQAAAQTAEDAYFTAHDELDKNMLTANLEHMDIVNQGGQLQQDLFNFRQTLRRTPVKQKARRTELENQITTARLNLDIINTRDLNNRKDIARINLEINQLQAKRLREQAKFGNKDLAIQAEQAALEAELITNRLTEQALLNTIQQQQQQQQQQKKRSKNMSASYIQPSYGSCSPGENTTPSAAQKLLARTVRDTLVHQLIRFTDMQYFKFENDLYVKRASGSFLADALDLGGNLAATITNGERAKTIINASLIAFRGGRKSASIHYFQEQTADVLISSMQTARNNVLTEIITQLKNDNVDEYPLDAALGDVIKYFYAGTLPRALQEAKKTSSNAAQQAEQEVRRVKLKSSPIVTEDERVVDDATDVLVELDGQVGQTDKPEVVKAATDKLQKIVTKLLEDASIKTNTIVTGKNLSATDNAEDILNKLVDIGSDLRTAQDFTVLNKFNRIIGTVGKEE